MTEDAQFQSYAVPRAYAPDLSPADQARPRLRTRSEVFGCPYTSLPGAQSEGSRRTSYAGIDATYCRTSVIDIPPGQWTPEHNSLVEHIIVGVEGATEWLFEGETTRRLERHDQLFIPARLFYSYRNTSLAPARVLAIISPATERWPDIEDAPTYRETSATNKRTKA